MSKGKPPATEPHSGSGKKQTIHTIGRFIPLLPGDCAFPDTLRCCKVVNFREESEAAFAKF